MQKSRKNLRVGITMGDMNGIGPELIIKAFSEQKLKEMCTPIVYGSGKVLNVYRKVMSVDKFSYNIVNNPEEAQPRKISVIECISNDDNVEIGKSSAIGGKGAYEALARAVEDLKKGEIDVLVTLPIDKHSIQNENFNFPGHTEYLTEQFGSENSMMLMISEKVKVGVVTGHMPLKNVSDAITTQGIVNKIWIMNDTLKRDFSIEKPKIAVLGLNPHAGDNGFLGKEDKEKITRAVEEAAAKKIFVLGPFSADGFFGSGDFIKYDGILAMYHDQGLIPFKLLAGFEGVNYTSGLPIIRTSPDHGVAYNLAGKDIADPSSFIHAIFTAIDIYKRRRGFDEVQESALKTEKIKGMMKDNDSGREALESKIYTAED